MTFARTQLGFSSRGSSAPGLAHVRSHIESIPLIRGHLDQQGRDLVLQDLVLAGLPEPLRAHCSAVKLTDGVLTLFLDSPAWATRARFLVDQISSALARADVHEIRTRVRLGGEPNKTGLVASNPRAAARPGLSRDTVDHLLRAADAMPDEDLAKIFRRFARHHGEPSEGRVGPVWLNEMVEAARPADQPSGMTAQSASASDQETSNGCA